MLPMRSNFMLLATVVLLGTMSGCGHDLSPTKGGTGASGGLVSPGSLCGDSSAPADCGSKCTSDIGCSEATFCINGKCDATCTASGSECGASADCVRGRCVEKLQTDGGGVIVDGCVEIEVETEPVIPNIYLIVDKSGSMKADFRGLPPTSSSFKAPSRWNAVKAALLGPVEGVPPGLPNPNGVITTLESVARFGFSAYSTDSSDEVCVDLVTQPPKLDNKEAIQTLWKGLTPKGSTPTAEAIDRVVATISGAPRTDGPSVIVLATDGEPTGCEDQFTSAVSKTGTENAVKNALKKGLPTYVIRVGKSTPGADAHFQALAVAGGGASAKFYPADDSESLATQLGQVTRQRACTVELGKEINPALACRGKVTLNGRALGCRDPDGWHVIDSKTISLDGDACVEWSTGKRSDLHATFPCGVVVE